MSRPNYPPNDARKLSSRVNGSLKNHSGYMEDFVRRCDTALERAQVVLQRTKLQEEALLRVLDGRPSESPRKSGSFTVGVSPAPLAAPHTTPVAASNEGSQGWLPWSSPSRTAPAPTAVSPLPDASLSLFGKIRRSVQRLSSRGPSHSPTPVRDQAGSHSQPRKSLRFADELEEGEEEPPVRRSRLEADSFTLPAPPPSENKSPSKSPAKAKSPSKSKSKSPAKSQRRSSSPQRRGSQEVRMSSPIRAAVAAVAEKEKQRLADEKAEESQKSVSPQRAPSPKKSVSPARKKASPVKKVVVQSPSPKKLSSAAKKLSPAKKKTTTSSPAKSKSNSRRRSVSFDKTVEIPSEVQSPATKKALSAARKAVTPSPKKTSPVSAKLHRETVLFIQNNPIKKCLTHFKKEDLILFLHGEGVQSVDESLTKKKLLDEARALVLPK